jgi:hypothetical protein
MSVSYRRARGNKEKALEIKVCFFQLFFSKK